MSAESNQTWPPEDAYIVEDMGYETWCWLWQRGMSGPYGFAYIGSKGMNAHRASWVHNRGPIPDGHAVHHRCKQTTCVRIDHLELRTATDHRHGHPESKKRSRLTAAQVEDIRISPLSLSEVAQKYGISKPYASTVRRGFAPSEFRIRHDQLPKRRPTELKTQRLTKLTATTISEIRSSSLPLRALGQKYGISPTYASLVRRGLMPTSARLPDDEILPPRRLTRTPDSELCPCCGRGRPRISKRSGIGREDYLIEDRGYTSPCWIWKGRNPASAEYGKIRFPDGHSGQAHIASYEQFIGSVPEGMHLDHECRVKRCINPSHLCAVTPADNVRSSSKLTWEIVRQIRASDEPHVALAKRYGVHSETIRFVRIGRTWKED